MYSMRLRGCAGCRKFPHICDELAAPSCDRFESLGDWCRQQAAWLDKAERDWMLILAMSSLVVGAVALLTVIA